MHDQAKLRVLEQVPHISGPARQEVIDAEDFVALGEEAFA
jgi:hypothetical protein